MPRLQTKCFFASTVVHGLLLALLIVGSAFVNPKPKFAEKTPFVVFDAKNITDDETSGGGNPEAVAPPPQPAPPVEQIQPQQSAPVVVKPVEPIPAPVEPKPEPVKPPEAKPKPKNNPPPQEKKKAPVNKDPEALRPKNTPKEKEKKPDEIKPEPPKHTVTPNLTLKKPDEDKLKKEKAERLARQREREEQLRAEAAAQEAARVRQAAAVAAANAQAQKIAAANAAAFKNALGTIQNNMTSGAVVEMPGPGGEAFVNYADVIWNKYYQAWQTPEERDVRVPVKVEIVVARDGRILSANIVSRSGDAVLDKSVRQALDRVRSLPAFPEGAKDAQRTFKINFVLKAKRQLG